MSRRRWAYTSGGMPCEPYEVPMDWTPPPRTEIVSDSHYEGLRATDGTPINSRKRHQEYMRQNGVTVASDFTNQWQNDLGERLARQRGDFDRKARREAVERALYKFRPP